MQNFEKEISSNVIRIRWISVQCYEIVLPNGKVIVTDPFYWDMHHFDNLTDLTSSQKMEKRSMRKADFPSMILPELITSF